MNESQPISPRVRLQELLAIPERQRTEAQWDEINELEITLTPVNRVAPPNQGGRPDAAANAGHPKPNSGPRDNKPARRLHKRPPKANVPRRTP